MQTECTPKLFKFEAVELSCAGFDGGNITSNAGALLLGQVDQGLGLVRRFAACFVDRRDPRYVEHQVEPLVGQRIFGLALGYEDLNDHDELGRTRSHSVPTYARRCWSANRRSTKALNIPHQGRTATIKETWSNFSAPMLGHQHPIDLQGMTPAKPEVGALARATRRQAVAAVICPALVRPRPCSHAPEMFVVSEAEATAIRAAFDQGGELSAAVELRRLFPG